MEKEEILAKSRTENKNQDIYEQEILKQANKYGVIVQGILATVFFLLQILVDKGINWGIYALVCSITMTTFWVKYIQLRRKHELMMAIAYTILVFMLSGYHIYNLFR